MANVLVSIRNEEEAKIAFEACVDLIDVKEPSKAAMGMVEYPMIEKIKNILPNGTNISMACGELMDFSSQDMLYPSGMLFYKFGMSCCDENGSWLKNWIKVKKQIEDNCIKSFIVPVFYADQAKAKSLSPLSGFRILQKYGLHAIMIDTWDKDGSSILDWISVDELSEIQNECESADIKLALAGSLDLEKACQIVREGIRPAWFGFRGAVCEGMSRNKKIDFKKAANLVCSIKKLGC